MATNESIRRAAKLLSVTSELPNQKDAECYADSAFRRSLLILVELVGPAASFPSSFDDVADIVVEVTFHCNACSSWATFAPLTDLLRHGCSR